MFECKKNIHINYLLTSIFYMQDKHDFNQISPSLLEICSSQIVFMDKKKTHVDNYRPCCIQRPPNQPCKPCNCVYLVIAAWEFFQLSNGCHHYRLHCCKFRPMLFSSEISFTCHTCCDIWSYDNIRFWWQRTGTYSYTPHLEWTWDIKMISLGHRTNPLRRHLYS